MLALSNTRSGTKHFCLGQWPLNPDYYFCSPFYQGSQLDFIFQSPLPYFVQQNESKSVMCSFQTCPINISLVWFPHLSLSHQPHKWRGLEGPSRERGITRRLGPGFLSGCIEQRFFPSSSTYIGLWLKQEINFIVLSH